MCQPPENKYLKINEVVMIVMMMACVMVIDLKKDSNLNFQECRVQRS